MFEYYTVLSTLSNFLHYRNNSSSQKFNDYFTIFIYIIVIIFSALIIWIVYKRYLRYNQEENEHEENNIYADEDKIRIEMQYLDENAFAFIPVKSPIKFSNVGNYETPKDEFNSENTNDSSEDMKVKSNAKMKNDKISSFIHSINNQNIEDAIKI